jgi:alpha-L-rhamnosidase
MDSLSLSRLRCEYAVNPLGIDVPQPRLSWQLNAPEGRRGTAQRAYRILVATSPEALASEEADLWDSGEIPSDDTAHIPYQGRALDSGERAWWTVMARDEQGNASAWAEPAFWEMGLLERTEWKGEWIGTRLRGGRYTSVPAPFLRKGFSLPAAPARARLYVTALGLYECSINGHRVGDDVFTPGWTDYNKRLHYQTYDVTEHLTAGQNALGAILGDGWWCGHVEWRGRQRWGQVPRLLAQLEVHCEDGSTHTILSDETWRCTFGPILESDILMGESYDARYELEGWSDADFDDGDWERVKLFEDTGVPLLAQKGVTVKRQMEITPIKDPWEIGSGGQERRIIFDLGQNMVGWVRLKVKGKRGTTITLRHAEILDEKGQPYYANLRSAKCIDYYTLGGSGDYEVFEPRFTFHGFRYVELYFRGAGEDLASLLEEITRDTVTGVVVHSDTPRTGSFSCSNSLLNQLQSNIEWGQRGNFLEVPTDCPQRDERLGWTGDAQIFIRTAAYNMDVAGFFTKWAEDVADSQGPGGEIPPVVPNTGVISGDGGPGWADACIICPWTIYLCYGDTAILDRHYGVMKRYMGFLESTARGFIRCYPGYEGWHGFGDWLNIDDPTPKDLIGTAFFAYAARLMARIAHLLGKPSDAGHYSTLFENIRDTFQRTYLTPVGDVASRSQAAYILALFFDLVPAEASERTAFELVEAIRRRGGHLSAGFLGSPYLNHVLTAAGRHDVACQLLLQTGWPSWLYAVTQGATTIWERWDGWTHDKGFQSTGMNSFNHYAYGAIAEWLYRVVAGINAGRPGYKHVDLQPRPGGGLTHAKATYRSLHGTIESGWRIEGDGADGRTHYEVTVPANTTATLSIPTTNPATVHESGDPASAAAGVRFERYENGFAVFELVSGRYHFVAE